MSTKKAILLFFMALIVLTLWFVFWPKENLSTMQAPMNYTATKKIIFIHHSVGGRWLAHEGGRLVSELNKKGFYVNDITYGWQPAWMEDSVVKKARNKVFEWFKYNPNGAYRIGDRTDIGHYYDWFIGPDSEKIMNAVYRENNETTTFGDHANAIENPGEELENEIVMIKPCYPNSLYRGKGDDKATTGENPPRNFSADSPDHTVANSKRIFNDILAYFKQRPDKFFVLIAAPPRRDLPDSGATARAFNNWLVHDYLRENDYVGQNVVVFDFYNVLTSGPSWEQNDVGVVEGNHHRMWDGLEQHVIQWDNNLLSYPRDGNNNHPSPAGLKKATAEFVDLFVHHYDKWEKR